MKKITRKLWLLPIVALSTVLAACGGSSGGGDDNGGSGSSTVTIQGTFKSAAAGARILGPGEGGIAGVTVSALGDSSVTDENGNFNLFADGNAFPGGEVQFLFSGPNVDEVVVLDGVLGGPGVMAFVNFTLEDNGDISGQSTDAAGNILGETASNSRLGCSVTQTFSDGGGGALWKPHAERTGTVVILMPPDYRNAAVEVFNNRNEVVATPIIRDCCSHNGGREHIYLSQTAGSLAGAGTPLTVRFQFGDGFTDCRTVPDPNQRYD